MKQPVNSKTFCILPWVHINSSVGGVYRTCCNSLNSFNLNEKNISIEDAFFSKDMKEVRQYMASGREHKACSVCYDKEKIGGLSFRQTYNNEKFKDLINENEDEEIKYLDIRFDNTCNLACRMCDPRSSNKISKTIEWYKNNNFKLPNHLSSFNKISTLYDYSEIRKSYIINNAEKIKILKVSGGEPFYNKSFLEIIEFLVSNNYSKDITLLITTNGTKFTKKILLNLSNFKSVSLTISVDGCGSTYDYIRYPFTWDRWAGRFENLLKYIEDNDIKNISINTSTIVSAYNWLNTSDLYSFLVKYIDKYKFLEDIHFKPKINFDLNLRPVDSELSAKWLSNEILEAGLEKWLLTDNRQINEFINYVHNAKTIDTDKKILKQKELLYITNTLDRERNQSFDKLDTLLSVFLRNLNETYR